MMPAAWWQFRAFFVHWERESQEHRAEMMQLKISGYTFAGPFESSDGLKDESGVYVVATDDGGNWKFLDCGQAGNVKSAVVNSDRQNCWEQHAIGSIVLFVKYCEVKGREMIAGEIRQDHQLPCG
jgi:hypothetical protein